MKLSLLAVLAALATPACANPRFPELLIDGMTPEQRQVADAILSGPRKSLGGPFNAWLRSPAMADRLQALGEQIRFHSSLPARINEFAILITARAWDAKYEWYAHYPLAIRAGLSESVARDLANGRRPRAMAADETAVYEFCTALRRDRRVNDRVYDAVRSRFGEQGVIDLIAVNGYYDLVSMTLNVAEVPTPADGALPLPDPRR